jgi:energy-converting hydrogenase A subunit M
MPSPRLLQSRSDVVAALAEACGISVPEMADVLAYARDIGSPAIETFRFLQEQAAKRGHRLELADGLLEETSLMGIVYTHNSVERAS